MSHFWSWWVMILVVINLGISLFLFFWGPWVSIPVAPDGTSGHAWAHGVLREGVRRLPVWWLLISGAAFAASISYLALYPGFGDFKGIFGWTSQQQLARQTAANQRRLDEFTHDFSKLSVEELARSVPVRQAGQRLFKDNCAACHDRSAHGNQRLGAPDLTDEDWLYGGDGQSILTSILGGRHGTMPAWGSAFGDTGIEDLANYVLSLSNAPHDAAKASAGKSNFVACAACHGASGTGNQALGAPNLTDSVWLYGGDLASIENTIRNGHGGVMPAWRGRLTDNEAKAIAAWVYGISHLREQR